MKKLWLILLVSKGISVSVSCVTRVLVLAVSCYKVLSVSVSCVTRVLVLAVSCYKVLSVRSFDGLKTLYNSDTNDVTLSPYDVTLSSYDVTHDVTLSPL